MNGQFEERIERLLTGEYCVIDILPEQVPEDSPGQFFSVEEYFRTSGRLQELRGKFADILLKLNCYDDIQVCFYPEEIWEKNPDPGRLAERICGMPENNFVRVLLESEEAMIDLDGCDIYMTVYGANNALMKRLEALAMAEGLFVRIGKGVNND